MSNLENIPRFSKTEYFLYIYFTPLKLIFSSMVMYTYVKIKAFRRSGDIYFMMALYDFILECLLFIEAKSSIWNKT